MSNVGAKLVGEAFAFAARRDLKPNETLLLLFMALTAIDSDLKPRYFASRERSAVALGRLVPEEPSPSDPQAAEINRQRTAAFQRVKTATTGLVKAGAICQIKRGREGQRAEYELTLGSVETRSLFGSEYVPLEGTEYVPLSASESVLQPGRNPYPQGSTKETTRRSGSGVSHRERASRVGSVDKSETSAA
jgi:hypothetical protein